VNASDDREKKEAEDLELTFCDDPTVEVSTNLVETLTLYVPGCHLYRRTTADDEKKKKKIWQTSIPR
jgi:hypothetical protein